MCKERHFIVLFQVYTWLKEFKIVGKLMLDYSSSIVLAFEDILSYSNVLYFKLWNFHETHADNERLCEGHKADILNFSVY
jgi:hypothetical protein